MAVVGIDFGTLHSKVGAFRCQGDTRSLIAEQPRKKQVGVARHRGIDIITNEVSNRATPSVVVLFLVRFFSSALTLPPT